MKKIGFFAVFLFLAGPSAWSDACTVPVFRYALERWRPSAYQIHLFHSGPLPAREAKLAEQLENASGVLNANFTRIDLAGKPSPLQQKLWQRHGQGVTPPWLIVQFPDDDDKAPPVWAGPLAQKNIDLLLDSPARRQLVKLLCRGESAVMILLESGDQKADEQARALLDRELDRLRKTLKLPVQEQETELATPLPLRISFAVLPVRRQDPAEDAFVRLLLQTEEDLDKVKGPIVFPVFGRGRALLSLAGRDLSAAQLERWANFLCGPCSCQVKELNPGVDLLISASWNELLETASEPETPVTTRVTAPAIPSGKVASTPSASAEHETPLPEPDSAPKPRARWWAWLLIPASLLAVLVLVLGRNGKDAQR